MMILFPSNWPALLGCVVFLFPSIASSAAAPEKLKIGAVDMQRLFKEYHKTAEAQKQINVERARIQKENNERLTRIRALEQELQGLRKQVGDPSISDKKRRAVMEEFQMKTQEGVALDRERREYLQRRNAALNEKMVQRMRGILEEIRKLVEDQAKMDDYDYVFDKSGLSASQVPFLLYCKDVADLTPDVLKELNKSDSAQAAVSDEGKR